MEKPKNREHSKRTYSQYYRKAWEEILEFKDWLTSVPNQPLKAYCKCCKQILNAHRLSLYKHVISLKHCHNTENYKEFTFVNAVIEPQNLKKKDSINSMENVLEMDKNINTKQWNLNYANINDDVVLTERLQLNGTELSNDSYIEPCAIYSENIDEYTGYEELNLISESEDDDTTTIEMSNQNIVSSITTHILDTSIGKPAADVTIKLYKYNTESDVWDLLNNSLTNKDGRGGNLLEKSKFTIGRYKLNFSTGDYFKLRNVDTLYPFIEIIFECSSVQEHYHIPLLLNPFGYSTYRGS